MQNAPFRFEPNDYFGFFREHGWRAEDIRYVPEEGQKLKRPAPLQFLWRWRIRLISFITGRRSQRAFQKSTAYDVVAAFVEGLVKSTEGRLQTSGRFRRVPAAGG